MTETTWDPGQYARFSDERSRPFHDLVARIGAVTPEVVVDLGCGNGPLTLSLAQRWPSARIIGIDNSPEMLAKARELDPTGRVEWLGADLAQWRPGSLGVAPDVVVSNAALQWVSDHHVVIDRVIESLAPDGWFAMQVPDNLDAPSHALMREVAATHSRASDLTPAVTRLQVDRPEAYLEQLAGLGCDVEVWSTTYLHVLDPAGTVEDPVLEWVAGTGLRPVLKVLIDEGEREEFLTDYRQRLRRAYPRTAAGVVLPFRRTFAVARKRSRS